MLLIMTMMVCRAFFSCLLVAVLTVSAVRGIRPPGSDVRVRCFSVVRCGLDQLLVDVTTAGDCCLGIGLSYAIPRTEECVNCVVYGWLNADSNRTIRVKEDGAEQRFEVGFIKRGVAPPPQITLTISDVEGTARRGAANDYTLSNTMLSISRISGDAATVTIREDGVALEEDKTFQLVLTATPQPIGNFFCSDVLNVVIEDSNVVDIQLTEDNYQASEADNNIRIVVSKNVVIATDVSLMIAPVTVSEARERGLFPAGAVPPGDLQGRSPVNADLNDFDNTVRSLTFRADENEPAPTNEIEVLVPIADDTIHEATEQIFVVILNLTDSVNPSGVVISRVSSLCRIIDNDPNCSLSLFPDCEKCEFNKDMEPVCVQCKSGFVLEDGKCELVEATTQPYITLATTQLYITLATTQPYITLATNDASTGQRCDIICIVGIVLAIVVAIILSAVVALVVYGVYHFMNNPETKLAKAGTEGLNGVARDNPFYLPPEEVIGDVETA